jgi:probable rRNA maturation factor
MFVPETAIAGLNEQYMGKLGSTDVLAFPLDAVEVVRSPGPGAMSRGPERVPLDISDLPVMLGDVVVCPAVAMRQAPSHAGNLDDEFALLIVHGILHVLGLDHDTDEKARTMQAAERKLLEQHHWCSAMPDSFRKVYES